MREKKDHETLAPKLSLLIGRSQSLPESEGWYPLGKIITKFALIENPELNFLMQHIIIATFYIHLNVIIHLPI